MYQGLHEIASIAFAGLAIKLLDDAVDEERMEYVPYIMVLLSMSIFLYKESVSLFLCSYIVGMFHDERLKLISRLKTWQEQVIVLIICIIFTSILVTLSSIFIICSVQLIDDIMDEKGDILNGKKNWAAMIGRVESTVLTAIFLIASGSIALSKTIICVFLALNISYIFNLLDR